MPVGLISAGLGAAGSSIGGHQQARAADRSADMQMQQFQQTREDLAPYRDAGGQGLDAYMRELGFTESGYNAPDLPDLSYDAVAEGFRDSPGYEYALEQGQQAIQNSASARGNLHSGNTQLELLRHAMGMADQNFGQYYSMNRQGTLDNHNLHQQQLSRLEGVANMGAQAATQTGQFGANTATNAGNMMMQGAASQAGGLAGAVNSINGGLANLQNQSLIQAAYPSYQPPTIGSILGGKNVGNPFSGA